MPLRDFCLSCGDYALGQTCESCGMAVCDGCLAEDEDRGYFCKPCYERMVQEERDQTGVDPTDEPPHRSKYRWG